MVTDKKELFEKIPVPKALASLAIPTIISQLISLVYNMVDAVFIGRTGNSYMIAATTLTLTLVMLNITFSNLFGVGGGSLIARLMGADKHDEAKSVSAYSLYGALFTAIAYSLLIGVFLDPLLILLGASSDTLEYARQYSIYVIVIGAIPNILSAVLSHLLRNVGCAKQASIGLSSGGILNILLDPLFMFVLLPDGYEVAGAAIATLLSNLFSCGYLLYAYAKAGKTAPLSLKFPDAKSILPENRKKLFQVGIPSAVLTGLFDLANIILNLLCAAHNDLVLAAMGIVLKVNRIPNALNMGLSQGMLPIVAYNYASGNHERMHKTIRTARLWGLIFSAICIVLIEIFAAPVIRLFLDTSADDAETAMRTLSYATVFLQIRILAAPVQFLNYNSSYSLQAMGNGKATMIHAIVRELVFYIPFMFLLNIPAGPNGLAAALPLGEACSAVFAIMLVPRSTKK